MYRVFHIDADPAGQRSVLQALADSPLSFVVEQMPDPTVQAPPPAGAKVDAILLGASGQVEPLDCLARWRQWFAATPIIVLTDNADLAFARKALQAGAQDVVLSHERALAVLSRILLYAIERASAEARNKLAMAEARTLSLLLDSLFAGTSDALIETDASGTILRATPGAAAAIGLDLPPPPGAHLAEYVVAADRSRLATFVLSGGTTAASLTATVGGKTDAASHLIELSRLPLAGGPVAGRRLFRIGELAAAFVVADDEKPLPTPPGWVDSSPMVRQRAPGGKQVPALAMDPPRSPLRQLGQIAEAASWHETTTTGGVEAFTFLDCDPESAQLLLELTAVAREDGDVALACDTLRVKAWQDAATQGPETPARCPVLEVSYGTVTSRPHFERLLAEIQASAPWLAQRCLLALQGVPKGIYVPTLGKAIRAMGSQHGKPALQLPDLEVDYRNLGLGQLSLLIIAIEDLKRALARDARQVSTILGWARSEGCRTVVRGATGALAEALRSRLGIDMTAAS